MLKGLVALIVLAIAVQNTCPYGYAGKTAVAASHVHNCPLKNHQPPNPDNPDRFDTGVDNLNHAYVFTAGYTRCFLEFLGPAESMAAVNPVSIQDAYLSPPHRPPRFSSPLYT